MRFVSTKIHGVLDYAAVPALLALPRLLGWSPRLTRLLTGSAVGLLGYSLLTRYELGVKRILPMPAHLALDAASGGLLCAAPLLLDELEPATAATLVGLGAFEIGASLTTKTVAPVRASWGVKGGLLR